MHTLILGFLEIVWVTRMLRKFTSVDQEYSLWDLHYLSKLIPKERNWPMGMK